MKNIFRLSGLVFLVIVFFWGVLFVYPNFRGSGPAFLPSQGYISEQLDTKSNNLNSKPGENTTGLPLKIPDGFSISVFVSELKSPRVLIRDPQGHLLVSQMSAGVVSALPDANNDGKVDDIKTVASRLNQPHGLAFQNGKLYIAETNAVSISDYNTSTFVSTNRQKIIDLPTGGNHGTRTIAFGPDGKLYITNGSSCNVCSEKDTRRAKMHRANADGSGFSEFAIGLRNTVFFTWHPITGMLWGTDMGRDLIGDDIPPDEINIIEEGKNYGWPNCYGKNVHDITFDASDRAKGLCRSAQASYIDIQAHSAPLGLAFIPAHESWPKGYHHNLLVAYHGSWNRTEPTGYKIVQYRLDDRGAYLGEEDFIDGWLQADSALGRPVDLNFDDEGNLFISDDKAGVIYIIKPNTS